MIKAGTSHIRRVLLAQSVVALVIPVCLLVIAEIYFWSGLAGGLVATIGNAYFAWKIFAKQRETTPEQVLGTFLGAEIGKAVLTIMLMISAFVMIKSLNVLAFMGVFMISYLTPIAASVFFNDDASWRTKNVR